MSIMKFKNKLYVLSYFSFVTWINYKLLTKKNIDFDKTYQELRHHIF